MPELDNAMTPEQLESTQEPQVAEETLIGSDELQLALEPPTLAGEKQTNSLAGQMVTVRGQQMNEEAIALAVQEGDPAAALAQAAEESFAEIERKIAQNAFDTAGTNPSAIKDATEQQSYVNALRTHPYGNEIAIIQAASNSTLKEAVQKEVAANLAMRNELFNMMDEQGKLDFALDVSGFFVPGAHTMKWENSKDAASEHTGLQLDGESIAGMIGSWQALPLDRRTALYPELVKTIVEASGTTGAFGFKLSDKNTVAAVAQLIRFLQPEGGERATTEQRVFLGLDIVPFIPAGVSGLKNLGKGGKAGNAFDFRTSPSGGGARKPTPEGSFPKTDPKKGVTVDGVASDVTSATVAKLPAPLRRDMEILLASSAELAGKKYNNVANIAAMGDLKTAAALNVAALDSEFIRMAHSIRTDDAIQNAMPWQTSEWMPEIVPDLVPEISRNLNDFFRKAEGKVRSVTTESDLLRVGALSKSERTYAIRSFEEEMVHKGEDFLQDGVALTDIKITGEAADSFTFEYTLTKIDPTDVSPLTDSSGVIKGTNAFSESFSGRRSWGVNQITGNYDETITALTESANIPGLSPAAWSVKGTKGKLDFHDTVTTNIVLEDVALATKSRINELWLDANSTINGANQSKVRAQVEAVELAGDEFINKGTMERGKVFHAKELLAGVETKMGTVRLTDPAAVEAYYKRRMVADAMHGMNNYLVRRELELGGNKSLQLATEGGDSMVFAKPFYELEQALKSTQGKEKFGVWDTEKGAVVQATPEYVRGLYERGRILTRAREDWNVSGNQASNGGEWVEYISVTEDKILQLPEQVFNYKQGYVPRLYQNVEFLVKQLFPKNKRGATGQSVRTEAVRAFSSKKDAQAFADGLAQQFAIKNNVALEDAKLMFTIGDGAELSALDRIEDGLSGSQGWMTKQRAKREILLGTNGIQLERVSPSDALARYVDHLGSKLARNEQRIGNEQNWINTVRRADPSIKVTGFNSTALPNTPLGKELGRMRDQINKWNRVPTKEETMWEAGAQKLHDWTLTGHKGLGLQKESVPSALWLKHAEPGNALLAANMHVFLGALNPAQLYVQASAATVALSLTSIKNIPNIIGKTAQYTVLDNIKNPKTLELTINEAVAAGQMSAQSAEIYRAWNRSGFRESVRSNADMNYTSATGLGITNDWIRKAGNASLLFYRSAELFNRRVSFVRAYLDTPVAKGVLTTSDDHIVAVVKEANRTMLELNAANKAWFQGGHGATPTQKVLQVMTQFQQVMAKTLELSVKSKKRGGFGKRELARIGIGQFAMFGAVGVPLISTVAAGLTSWITDTAGFDPADPEDAETIKSIANTMNQGMSGVISREVFGAEIETASRVSLGLGVFDVAKDMLTSEDPMWVKLLGVSGNLGQRVGNAANQASLGLKSHALAALAENEPLALADRRSFKPMSKERILATAKDIARLMLTIPTTSRNILKARMMEHSNKIQDRHNRTIVEHDFNFATKLGVAMGFQPSEETRTRAIQQDNRYNEELVQEAADVLTSAYHRYVYTHNLDPAYADNLRDMIQTVQETLDNDYLVEQLRRRLENNFYNDPQTLQERELKKYFDRTATERISRGMIMDSEQMFNPSKIFSPQPVIVPFADVPKKEDK